ncbi:glycosyltransferase family 4 protein [bacterium]|nr:glycosyltransferase family 4 protein [bacterium]
MKPTGGVCFLFDDFHPVFSGHAIYMRQIMRRLAARGRALTVICWNPGGLPATEDHEGIRIVRVAPPRSDLERGRRVLGALWSVRDRFDCLHVNGFPDPYLMWVAFCRLLGKRLVLQSTLMGSDDGEAYRRNHRGGALRVRQLACVDAITAISRPLIASFTDIGFPADKLVYLPQGVDLARFTPATAAEKRALRSERGLDPDGPLVLFVGTILERKGVDLLVEAWAAVQARLPGAQLALVGMHEFDGSHENRDALNAFAGAMRERVAAGGLRVVFAGLHNDIVPWYRAADLFVLPSRKEGFGNVILEAMACRVPVVVTPMDGVALETVDPGVNGLIVRDVPELAAGIASLLEDPERAARFGEAGAARVRRLFDLEAIADRYDELYFPR